MVETLKNGKLAEYSKQAADKGYQIIAHLMTTLNRIKTYIPRKHKDLHGKLDTLYRNLQEVKTRIHKAFADIASQLSEKIGKILEEAKGNAVEAQSKTAVKRQQKAKNPDDIEVDTVTNTNTQTAKNIDSPQPITDPARFEHKTDFKPTSYTLPNGQVTQVVSNGKAIVQLDKVEQFARGNLPNVQQELNSLQKLKQADRKAFDSNPLNEKRLDILKHQNRSFSRSQDLQKKLESIGLGNTPANNKIISEHLLSVGKKVTPDNRIWVPSVLNGPKGKLKVESTWKVLDDGKAYLSTIKFIPIN